MNHEIRKSLARLYQSALKKSAQESFSVAFDPEWRSECEISQNGGDTFWRPRAQSLPVDFSGLANAVEQPIHPDICSYYGSYWAGPLEATSEEGHVSLIQLWNPDDFDRLIANLVGHFMAKQRLKQPFTVFFANTEPDSELFLSIDNKTGNVLLEEPSKAPLQIVEQDLATFLNRLTPITAAAAIY